MIWVKAAEGWPAYTSRQMPKALLVNGYRSTLRRVWRLFLCVALILAGGLHVSDTAFAQGPGYQVHASVADDQRAPCKTGGDHRVHAGCLTTNACVNLMAVPEFAITIVTSDLPIWWAVARPFVGHDITPAVHPPKLSPTT